MCTNDMIVSSTNYIDLLVLRFFRFINYLDIYICTTIGKI